jgi:valyl-tRNA synthetase
MNYKRPLPREENFYSEDPQEFVKRAATAIHQQMVTEFETALNSLSKKTKLKKIDQSKLTHVIKELVRSFEQELNERLDSFEVYAITQILAIPDSLVLADVPRPKRPKLSPEEENEVHLDKQLEDLRVQIVKNKYLRQQIKMQIKSVDRENEQLQHCLNSSNLLDIAKQFGVDDVVNLLKESLANFKTIQAKINQIEKELSQPPLFSSGK